MSKVALVIPNMAGRDEFGDISDPPIGIASIGASLEKIGHEVLIVDGLAENLTQDQILRRVSDFQSRFIGVGCNYCTLHNATLRLVRLFRSALGSSVKIFAGGNHASALSSVLLRQAGGDLDCVAYGEGEGVVPQLVEALAKGEPLGRISGISFLESGRIVRTSALPLIQDIDALPLPAYHLLPMDRYKRYNIVSMRGCPFACAFCASTVLFSRRVRYRSPKKVAEEVELLVNTYGERQVWFSDDTFTVNTRRTRDLLAALDAKGLRVSWSCMTTINRVEPRLLNLMRKAGCRYISYGIETGNRDFLRAYIGKDMSIDAIQLTSRMTQEAGLAHYGFFILGFPGETWETLQDTFELIRGCALSGGAMNLLIPLPGTRLWTKLFEEEKAFTIDELDWDNLFARIPGEHYRHFPAELASRWCSLSAEGLIQACRTGRELLQHPHASGQGEA